MSYKTLQWVHQLLFVCTFVLTAMLSCACDAQESKTSPDPKFVQIRDLADRNGFKEVKVTDEQITLKSPWTRLEFYKYSRKAALNGTTIWLNAATLVSDGKWAITRADYDKTIMPILRPFEYLAEFGYKTIVLDPGHGGQDSGGVGPGTLLEKNIALEISRSVRKGLEEMGYQVHLTRDSDKFIELEERCAIAGRLNADLFVSIHCNAGANVHAEGVETYSLSIPSYPSTNDGGKRKSNDATNLGNKHDNANVALGHAVQKSIVSKSGRADRGLRRARFVVLRDAPCPATLVECGFLSNAVEAKLLQNQAFVERISHALVIGIDDYIGQVRKAHLIAAEGE